MTVSDKTKINEFIKDNINRVIEGAAPKIVYIGSDRADEVPSFLIKADNSTDAGSFKKLHEILVNAFGNKISVLHSSQGEQNFELAGKLPDLVNAITVNNPFKVIDYLQLKQKNHISAGNIKVEYSIDESNNSQSFLIKADKVSRQELEGFHGDIQDVIGKNVSSIISENETLNFKVSGDIKEIAASVRKKDYSNYYEIYELKQGPEDAKLITDKKYGSPINSLIKPDTNILPIQAKPVKDGHNRAIVKTHLRNEINETLGEGKGAITFISQLNSEPYFLITIANSRVNYESVILLQQRLSEVFGNAVSKVNIDNHDSSIEVAGTPVNLAKLVTSANKITGVNDSQNKYVQAR